MGIWFRTKAIISFDQQEKQNNPLNQNPPIIFDFYPLLTKHYQVGFVSYSGYASIGPCSVNESRYHLHWIYCLQRPAEAIKPQGDYRERIRQLIASFRRSYPSRLPVWPHLYLIPPKTTAWLKLTRSLWQATALPIAFKLQHHLAPVWHSSTSYLMGRMSSSFSSCLLPLSCSCEWLHVWIRSFCKIDCGSQSILCTFSSPFIPSISWLRNSSLAGDTTFGSFGWCSPGYCLQNRVGYEYGTQINKALTGGMMLWPIGKSFQRSTTLLIKYVSYYLCILDRFVCPPSAVCPREQGTTHSGQ